MEKIEFIRSREGTEPATRRLGLKWGLLAAAIVLMFARTAPAAGVGPADLGQAKITATTLCAACHGEDGNSVAPIYPKLAGLSREYLTKQLTEFMSGKRKNDMMSPVAAKLNPEDVAQLAAYFSKLKLKPGTEQNTNLAEEGELLFVLGNETTGVPACSGCHGKNGEGTTLVPRLAGQNGEYLLTQMKNFNSDIRTNDPNRFMRVVTQRMTQQEMKALAEYLNSLELRQR